MKPSTPSPAWEQALAKYDALVSYLAHKDHCDITYTDVCSCGLTGIELGKAIDAARAADASQIAELSYQVEHERSHVGIVEAKGVAACEAWEKRAEAAEAQVAALSALRDSLVIALHMGDGVTQDAQILDRVAQLTQEKERLATGRETLIAEIDTLMGEAEERRVELAQDGDSEMNCAEEKRELRERIRELEAQVADLKRVLEKALRQANAK